jgi:hypothetical protein
MSNGITKSLKAETFPGRHTTQMIGRGSGERGEKKVGPEMSPVFVAGGDEENIDTNEWWDK